MGKIILALFVLALGGCMPPPGEKSSDTLIIYVDKENGVNCYRAPVDTRAFSCVKVSNGVGK